MPKTVAATHAVPVSELVHGVFHFGSNRATICGAAVDEDVG